MSSLSKPSQLDRIRLLLEKFERNECTEEELRQLHQWLDDRAAAGKDWVFTGEKDKLATKNSIAAAVFGQTRRPRKSIGLRYTAAAAAVLLLVCGITLLHRSPGETVIVSAPGAVRKIGLPDGSVVWLNNNTEVAFGTGFSGARTIELRHGEAFFQVAKDPSRVFSVRSHGLTTTVLGTSFSAKTIGQEGDARISVVTGRVMVSRQGTALGTLQAGQRLRYDESTGHAAIDSVPAGEAEGWTHGDILLQNVPLGEVIQWLQDHFNVRVHNTRPISTGEYYLEAKSDIPLPEALQVLNLLGKKEHVHFLLQNQTVIIQ